MKLRSSFYIITCCLSVLANFVFAQPAILFSDTKQFQHKPHIIGKTENRYFCLYPADSIPSLVIYDTDLREKSRLRWDSIVAAKTTISYHVFTVKNKLSILLKEKTTNGQQLKAVDIDENGNLAETNILFSDTTEKNNAARNYEVEISKNGKYILLYRGIRTDEEHMLFEGALFDNNWTLMKSFNYPLDKQDEEDSWYGATLDIEGNIHTMVFTSYNNWKLGTTIRIHTIPRTALDLSSEQVDIRRKRLINYSLREDTLPRSLQLQAITVQQNSKDPFAGISFVTFPFQRGKKISYLTYEFTADQKRNLYKGITSQKKLIDNSSIKYSSGLFQGGYYFTSILVTDYKETFNKQVVGRLMPESLSTTNQSFVYDANQQFFPNRNMPGMTPAYRYGDNYGMERAGEKSPDQIVKNIVPNRARLAVIKNGSDGKLESWAQRDVYKSNEFVFDGQLLMIKNDSLQMLAYLFKDDVPSLFHVIPGKNIESRKIKMPEHYYLLLQDAMIISDEVTLVPYLDNSMHRYGIAKIIF